MALDFQAQHLWAILCNFRILKLLENGARSHVDGTSSVINVSSGCATLKSILPYNSVRLAILIIVNSRG